MFRSLNLSEKKATSAPLTTNERKIKTIKNTTNNVTDCVLIASKTGLSERKYEIQNG